MNTLLLIISLILTYFLNGIVTYKIIVNNKLNNDFLFIILSNIILTLAFLFFFIFTSNLMFTFYIAFFHMIFAFLFIYNVKNIFKSYTLLTLPYFFLWVYVFAKILIIYLF